MRLFKEKSGEYRIGSTCYYIRHTVHQGTDAWDVVWYRGGQRHAKPRTWDTKKECVQYARRLLADGELPNIED